MDRWINLLPEDQRRRWAWLLGNQGGLGMPRRVDLPASPLSGNLPASFDNPITGLGDILGILGTAIKDPIQENALEPTMGALMAARDQAARHLPSLPSSGNEALDTAALMGLAPTLGLMSLGADTQAAAPSLSIEGLRNYGRQQSEAGGPWAQIGYQTATDPLSYVGGPLGKGATALGEVLPGLAPLAGRVAAADTGYQAAIGAGMEAIKGVVPLLAKAPGIGGAFEKSPLAASEAFSTNLHRAITNIPGSTNLERAIGQNNLGLNLTAEEWGTKIAPGWLGINTATAGLEHPLQQAAVMEQRKLATEWHRIAEERAAQRRAALLEELDGGIISEAEARTEIKSINQMQIKAARAIQLGLKDAIEAVKGIDPTILPTIGPDDTRFLNEQVQATIDQIQGVVKGSRDFATSFTGGQVEGEMLPGLMDMKDISQRIRAAQAVSTGYTHARNETVAAIDQLNNDILSTYSKVAGPADIKSIMDVAHNAFTSSQVGLADAFKSPEELFMGMGPENLDPLLSVWNSTDAANIRRWGQRILTARESIIDKAMPVLRDFHRVTGQQLAPDALADIEQATGGIDALLAHDAFTYPQNQTVRNEIWAIAEKYLKFGGDPLNPDDFGTLAASMTADAYNRVTLGMKKSPPWLSWAAHSLSAWKSLAVLSERFLLSNWLGILSFSAAHGVDLPRVNNFLSRNFKTLLATGQVDDTMDAAVSPVYASLRGTKNGAIAAPAGALGRTDAMNIPGLNAKTTPFDAVPMAIRTGVPALATGAAAWSNTPEDSPDRIKNAVIGALTGAAFGAGVSHLVKGNFLLQAVEEKSARMAASFTGFESFVGPELVRNAAGHLPEGQLKTIYDAIPGLLDPIRQQTVGKEIRPFAGPTPAKLAKSSAPVPTPTPMTENEAADAAFAYMEQLQKKYGTAWTSSTTPEESAHFAALNQAERAAQATANAVALKPIMATMPDTGPVPLNRVEAILAKLQQGARFRNDQRSVAQDLWKALITEMASGPSAKLDPVSNGYPHLFTTMTIEEAMAAAAEFKAGSSQLGRSPQPVLDQVRAIMNAMSQQSAATARAPLALAPPRPPTTPPTVPAPSLPSSISTMQELFAPGVTVRGTPQISIRGSGPSPVATAGTQVNAAKVQEAFLAAKGLMTPDALYALAIDSRVGNAMPEQAAVLRSAYDSMITKGEIAGVQLSNDINYNYADVSKGVQFLRESGLAPFLTWQTKAMPKFAQIMLQHPGFILAWDEYNNVSQQEAEEAGLSQRYAGLASMGKLGDLMAQVIIGRRGALQMNPLQAVLPYAELGLDRGVRPNPNPLEQGLDLMTQAGLGLSPIATLPLMATGAIGELPPSLFRTSGYLGAANQAMTGVEANPEMVTQRAMRGLRELFGAKVEETVTGDFLKDRMIRQRIAEMAVEQTGKPPAGAFKDALDNPQSPIWLAAQRQVERQRSGQTLLGATVPARTRFLSDTEADLRARQERQGVAPQQLAEQRTAPPTEMELATAAADIKRRPLRPGESLQERVASNRISPLWKKAATADPLTTALNTLGGSEADTLHRQQPEFFAFLRRVNHLPPQRRGDMMQEYLATRPVLRRWWAENRQF